MDGSELLTKYKSLSSCSNGVVFDYANQSEMFSAIQSTFEKNKQIAWPKTIKWKCSGNVAFVCSHMNASKRSFVTGIFKKWFQTIFSVQNVMATKVFEWHWSRHVNNKYLYLKFGFKSIWISFVRPSFRSVRPWITQDVGHVLYEPILLANSFRFLWKEQHDNGQSNCKTKIVSK